MSTIAAAATENQDTPTSFIVFLIVLLVGGTIYTFGYLRAVMHRANKDYKTTKAAVPTLRKGFWAAWWAAVKIGALVVIGFVILIVWAGKDLRDAGDKTPVPAKVSPSVRHR